MVAVSDRDTAMYKVIQMTMEAMMPIGRSRDGRLHSSADVATASKPMYEKKTIAAPLQTPRTPKGVKGDKLAAWA